MLKRVGILAITVALALGLLALPASAHHLEQNCPEVGVDDNMHPSGKDRSCESGGSGTQGKASSDPDDNGKGPERTNGRSDKLNGNGGVDHADQDGNTGCGNDDDFEDDNEGWCGKKRRNGGTNGNPVGSTGTPPITEVSGGSFTAPTPSPVIEVLSAGGSLAPEPTEVLGVQHFRPLTPKATAVLGEQLVRGQTMARTGVNSAALLLAAMFLTVMGMAFLRISKVRASSAE
jgi:hypothetical protein